MTKTEIAACVVGIAACVTLVSAIGYSQVKAYDILDERPKQVFAGIFCTNQDQTLLRKTTLECIVGAGRGGDAEPEDYVYDCENIAKDLVCSEHYTIIDRDMERLATQEEIDTWFTYRNK